MNKADYPTTGWPIRIQTGCINGAAIIECVYNQEQLDEYNRQAKMEALRSRGADYSHLLRDDDTPS